MEQPVELKQTFSDCDTTLYNYVDEDDERQNVDNPGSIEDDHEPLVDEINAFE